MANYLVTDTDLTAVANAIRAKGGIARRLSFPAEYVSAINALDASGGNFESNYDVQVYTIPCNGTDPVALPSGVSWNDLATPAETTQSFVRVYNENYNQDEDAEAFGVFPLTARSSFIEDEEMVDYYNASSGLGTKIVLQDDGRILSGMRCVLIVYKNLSENPGVPVTFEDDPAYIIVGAAVADLSSSVLHLDLDYEDANGASQHGSIDFTFVNRNDIFAYYRNETYGIIGVVGLALSTDDVYILQFAVEEAYFSGEQVPLPWDGCTTDNEAFTLTLTVR